MTASESEVTETSDAGKLWLHFKLETNKNKPVHFEVNPQDFYKLLQEMERAKGHLESLSSIASNVNNDK